VVPHLCNFALKQRQVHIRSGLITTHLNRIRAQNVERFQVYKLVGVCGAINHLAVANFATKAPCETSPAFLQGEQQSEASGRIWQWQEPIVWIDCLNVCPCNFEHLTVYRFGYVCEKRGPDLTCA
jgi:hypothetical protein